MIPKLKIPATMKSAAVKINEFVMFSGGDAFGEARRASITGGVGDQICLIDSREGVVMRTHSESARQSGDSLPTTRSRRRPVCLIIGQFVVDVDQRNEMARHLRLIRDFCRQL